MRSARFGSILKWNAPNPSGSGAKPARGACNTRGELRTLRCPPALNIWPSGPYEKPRRESLCACRVLDHTQTPAPTSCTTPPATVAPKAANQSGRKARNGQGGASATPLGSAKDFVGRSGPSPYALQRFAATLTSHGGLSACFWLMAFGASGVAVKGRPDGEGFDKIRLGGLAVCGSHLCPVCGPRVANKRADEVRAVLDEAKAQMVWPIMTTLTAHHTRDDRLAPLLADMKEAQRLWRRHRAFSRLRPHLVGSISKSEETHGANGWHPHAHIILFVRAPSYVQALRKVAGLRKAWEASLESVGRKCGRAGFQAQRAERAGRYVAKWDAASEMTQDAHKAGQGRNPPALLRDAYAGDKRAAALWAEWAKAVKGRSVLRFSQGLRAWAGLDAVSDEEAATPEPGEAERLIDIIDGGKWQAAQAGGMSVDGVRSAARDGRAALRAYLAPLVAKGAQTAPRRSARHEAGEAGGGQARHGPSVALPPGG